MSSFLDKLNLRPQEKRLVVVVAIVVFVVINIWFIFPVFGELGKTQQRIRDRKLDLAKFEAELAKEAGYKATLRDLEAMGFEIPLESQTLAFSREVQDKALLSGVNLRSSTPGTRGTLLRTNEFFQEQTLIISVANTRENQLVDFLYSLGRDNSLTRVSSMMIRPDPSKIYLAGNMTLVKSFQKQTSGRSAPRSSSAADDAGGDDNPAPKPAATEPAKTTSTPPPGVNRKPPGAPASPSPGGASRTPPRRTLPKPANPQ